MITENVDKNYDDHDMMLGRNRLARLLEDMRELWEQMKEPFIIRKSFLLLSLSIFAVFPSSSGTVHDNDFVMISNCSAVPLMHCPSGRKLIAFRERCINGFERDVCMAGSTYLCGIVDAYIIETCAIDMECWPGTFFNFVIRNGTVTVECVRCPDGTFETEHTKTSQSSHVLGCSYRHIPQDDISSNLMLYENGTHATPSIYRCKTEDGFFDEYGNNFCDDIQSHRCKCIFKYCEPGYQLHPTGHCRRCKMILRPAKNWRCEDYDSYHTTSTKKESNIKSAVSGALSIDGSASSGHLKDRNLPLRNSLRTNTNQDVIKVTKPTRDISPSSTDCVHTDSDNTHTLGVVLGVVTVAIFCFLVFFLLLKCKNRSKTVGHKEPLSPTITVHDKSNPKFEITNVYSYGGNVQLGDKSEMINMVSAPVKDGLPKKQEDIDDAGETLPDHLKLRTLESVQLLQESDSEDNDNDQTAKKSVI